MNEIAQTAGLDRAFDQFVMQFRPLVLALALVGCSTNASGPNKNPEPPRPRPPVTAPDTVSPDASVPVAKGEACGGSFCTPPEECATIIGMLEGAPPRYECWIPCGQDNRCSDGSECGMVHDGVGPNCGQVNDDDDD